MKKVIITFFLSLGLLACSSSDDGIEIAPPGGNGNNTEYPKPISVDNIVVAHRGGSMEAGLQAYPDNSLASLGYAIGLGCYASECDIYITKDEKVVVAHATSNDKINGFHPWEATYEQIKSAGKLSNGEEIPTLEMLIDKVLEAGSTRLWIDIKSITAVEANLANQYSTRAAVKAAEIIKEKKAKYFVEFIVGRVEVYKEALIVVRGDWKCAYMNTSYSPKKFQDNGFRWANFSIESAFYNNGKITGDYTIEDYNKSDVRVSVYNVDTPIDREWYVAKKEVLYAICTNYPKAMLNALK